jgi:hypothetical protein
MTGCGYERSKSILKCQIREELRERTIGGKTELERKIENRKVAKSFPFLLVSCN